MDFSSAVVGCFVNFASFRGRAVRAEFWHFQLFYMIVSLLVQVVEIVAGGKTGYLSFGASLICFLPSLSVSVRRLHDTDRSGWWWLLGFVPLIGWSVLIFWACQPGTDGPNRFDDPDAAVPAGMTSAPASPRPRHVLSSSGPRGEFGSRHR